MKVLLFLISITLTGCQSVMYGTAKDFNKIQLGMTRGEVISILGDPLTSSADAGSGEEKLTYKRMAHVMGWSPTFYDVTFKNGKVAKYAAQE
jgi:hypothetical protein